MISSPVNAYVSSSLAGDTAQSISKDSLFRFENAKALFYTKFKDQFPDTGNRQSGKSGVVPKLLHLSHNYRSHEGIISVASVVMDLLYGGILFYLKLHIPSLTCPRVPTTGR